jgi:RNA polymerase sigma-70 factor (ECF subfamily)
MLPFLIGSDHYNEISKRAEVVMQQHSDAALADPDIANIAGLYRRYAPTIFAHVVQRTASEQDAEDILVEVFLAALESEPFLALPEKAQLAWLWRVARNKAVDVYRRSTRQHSVMLESIPEGIADDDIGPEGAALRQEEYGELQAHIKRLSPLQQEVLQLRFGQDMRCSEIAAHLGKHEGAVKVMLSRTLNLLKNIYKVREERE